MKLNRNIISVGVVLVVIIIGGFIIFGPSKKTTTDTKPVLNGAPAGPNAVYVPDQKPSDNIFVSVVVLKEPGYIIIHREENGAPGAIIGVSEYLKAGEYWKVRVPMRVAVSSGTKLFAMLHKDNGDLTFSFKEDLPVGLDKHEVIMTQFTVDDKAPEISEISK